MSEIKFSRTQLSLENLSAFLKMLGINDPDDPLIKNIQGIKTRLQATEDFEAARNRRDARQLSFKAEVIRFEHPDFGKGDLLLIGRQDESCKIDPFNTNRWIRLPQRVVKKKE